MSAERPQAPKPAQRPRSGAPPAAERPQASASKSSAVQSSAARPGSRWERPLMFALRYVLPTVTVLGGLIVMAFGTEIDLEGGAGIVSAGLAIYAMNWLYRASIEGDEVREQEAAARAYFSAHGHWPDEAPPPARPAEAAPLDAAASAAATEARSTAPSAGSTAAHLDHGSGSGSAAGSGRLQRRPLRPHASSGSRRRPRGD